MACSNSRSREDLEQVGRIHVHLRVGQDGSHRLGPSGEAVSGESHEGDRAVFCGPIGNLQSQKQQRASRGREHSSSLGKDEVSDGHKEMGREEDVISSRSSHKQALCSPGSPVAPARETPGAQGLQKL